MHHHAPIPAAQHHLSLFLRTLCNLDPYTFTDEVVEHFSGEAENHQQTPEEILASALDHLPDEKLTSFALRLALTGYVDIPRENEFDFLAEAEAAFVLTAPKQSLIKRRKPTAIKPTEKNPTKKSSPPKKKIAA